MDTTGIKEIVIDRKAYNSLLTIADIRACKLPVDYPGIVNPAGKKYSAKETERKNNIAAHQWFTENYKFGKAPKTRMPEILDINDEKKALRWKQENREGR